MRVALGPDRRIFDDEHRLFRETAAAFVDAEIVPCREDIRARRALPPELWTRAGDQGLLGIGIPEEHGGADVRDFRFNAILQEELARAGMAYASSLGIHTDVVTPYLVELTDAAQRDRWLPGVASGALVTAIAMTEPEAGSDLAAMRTTAHPAGGGWVLNGAKTFITNGLSAGLVVVAARTSDGSAGRSITLFAVEEGMTGFARGRKLDKIGQSEADTAELFFDDVHVPAENVIGTVGAGFGHMMERLAIERMSAACANLGHAVAAAELTLAYVQERHAFGRAIGTFQHNRFAMAEIATELEVSQAYVDLCLMRTVEGRLTAVDAAKVKWWTADVQNRVLDRCVQMLGGYGYMQEYDVARAWADARVTKVWAGSNEIMKEIVGRSLGLGDTGAGR